MSTSSDGLPKLNPLLRPDEPITYSELLAFGRAWLAMPYYDNKHPRQLTFKLCTGGYKTRGFSGTNRSSRPFQLRCNECRGCLVKTSISSFLDLVRHLIPDRWVWDISTSRKLAGMPITIHVLSDISTSRKTDTRTRTTRVWAHLKKQAECKGIVATHTGRASYFIASLLPNAKYIAMSSSPMESSRDELFSEEHIFPNIDDLLEFLVVVAMLQPAKTNGAWRLKGIKLWDEKSAKFYLGAVLSWSRAADRHTALQEAGIKYGNPDPILETEEPTEFNPHHLCKQGPEWLKEQFGLLKPSRQANDSMRGQGWTQEEIDFALSTPSRPPVSLTEFIEPKSKRGRPPISDAERNFG
jgi:hypothetical protein